VSGPPDVVTTILVNGGSRRPQRFWAFESIPFVAEFREGPRGPLMDVTEMTFGFAPPVGPAIVPEPAGFIERVSVGTYRCLLAPAAGGLWQVMARCMGPTSSVAVATFGIAPLPTALVTPAAAIVTDTSRRFALLTRDGLLLRTPA